jgi:hypothetical protein
MALSKLDEILALADIRPPLQVYIKAWKDHVYLADPTSDMRDEWEIFVNQHKDKPAKWRAKLASLVLCDEQGNRIAATDDAIAKLGKKSAAAMVEIWEHGLRMFGVTDDEVEELAKN